MNGKSIKCIECNGYGIVDGQKYHEVFECKNCNGTGRNWVYTNGTIAKFYSGPFIGKLTQKEIKECLSLKMLGND